MPLLLYVTAVVFFLHPLNFKIMVYRKFSASRLYLQPQVGVTANIVLGSPKKNCAGIGICRIEKAQSQPSFNTRKTKCGQAKALLVMKQQKLTIYFVKHTLPLCTKQKHFASRQFRIEERVRIPKDMAAELKLPSHAYIETGNYDMIDLGQHFCIAVNIEYAMPPSAKKDTIINRVEYTV